MPPPSTQELIWGHSLTGFWRGLAEARAKARVGNTADADLARASVYYSFGLVPLARLYVWLAIRKGTYERWTHGQCELIGTVLLRRFFWIKPKPSQAEKYFDAGLARNPPPHSKALMRIGLAEAGYLQDDQEQVLENLQAAIWLRREVLQEQDRRQALRQYTRVFRRAMVLAYYMGLHDDIKKYGDQALQYAEDELCGSLSQQRKVIRALKRIEHPHWWHRYYD